MFQFIVKAFADAFLKPYIMKTVREMDAATMKAITDAGANLSSLYGKSASTLGGTGGGGVTNKIGFKLK